MKTHHELKGCWRTKTPSTRASGQFTLDWKLVTCWDCIKLKPNKRKFGPYLHATVPPTPTNRREGERDSFGGGL